MSRSECKACSSIDYSTLRNKGNGRCKHCNGSGKFIELLEASISLLLGDFDEMCKHCQGSGECKICGGEGFIYKEEIKKRKDRKTSPASTQKSHSSTGGSGSGFSGDSGIIGEIMAYGFVVLLIWILGLLLKDVPETMVVNHPTIARPAEILMEIPSNSNDYPSENQIKLDLVGKSVIGWDFKSINDFRKFHIIKDEVTNNILYRTADVVLQKVEPLRYWKTQIRVSYKLFNNGWKLYNQDEISYAWDIPATEITPPYPDVDDVQKELIGKSVEDWTFHDLSEFEGLEFLERELDPTGYILISKVKILLTSQSNLRRCEIEATLNHNLTKDERWQFDKIAENSIINMDPIDTSSFD